MILLTDPIRFALRANDIARRAKAERDETFDPPPVVKLFNPLGSATWLLTELGEDEDSLFGLCDLGFGSPELGYVSLQEIESLRLPLGLRIERDQAFKTRFGLSVWAAWARRSGSILAAEAAFNRAGRGSSTSEGD